MLKAAYPSALTCSPLGCPLIFLTMRAEYNERIATVQNDSSSPDSQLKHVPLNTIRVLDGVTDRLIMAAQADEVLQIGSTREFVIIQDRRKDGELWLSLKQQEVKAQQTFECQHLV